MSANEVIAVMDLEWTAWEGSHARKWSGPGEEREIIQIGAIKLDNTDALTELDSFDVMVKPTINPELSDYIINFTGITQSRLNAEGVSFPVALKQLVAFFGGDTKAVYSWGTDFKVIKENCQLNNLFFPLDETLFINARELLSRTVDSALNDVYSSGLPEAVGFPPPGTAHQGIDDCYCIAETFRIFRKQGKF
ncbi:MAG: exonuclease domain-containing protein [Proteobacteria bacterium]|nr:exonuclease domain-containing protein [Pseudomonadota bacterium]